MNEDVEKIDSREMEILSEFESEIEKGEEFATHYRLGVLNGDLIITSQATIAFKPQGKIVPADIEEEQKEKFRKIIERDWWSGVVLFELKNYDGVLQRLEEMYGERPAREINMNELDIVNGKDQIAISKNSVMPNNVGTPIVTTQINNFRLVELDDSQNGGWRFYASPETGLKLMDEMKRIRPVIQQKLTS